MENKIRERREALGLSQPKLARMIGTDQNRISHWEHQHCDPQLFYAIRLAQALDTTVEELFSP